MFPRAFPLLAVVALTACQPTSAPKSEPEQPVEYEQPLPALTVKLLGQWDGWNVPPGEQCFKDGGNGATPPMRVTGIPEDTSELYVFFDDIDDPSLSQSGGLGVVAFHVFAVDMILPPLPAMTKKVGSGARVVQKARTTGEYASDGYLPPCSGAQGHRYVASVVAMAENDDPLAAGRTRLGNY